MKHSHSFLPYYMKVSSGERRKFIVLFMDSVQINRVALFANTRKVTASECKQRKVIF